MIAVSYVLEVVLVYADTSLYLSGVSWKRYGHPSQTALF